MKPTRQDAEHVTLLLERHFLGGLTDTVAWFHDQMPEFYFRVTTEQERVRHLEVFHSLRRMHDARLAMLDDGEAGKVLFFGRPSPNVLLEALKLLGERSFHRMELHGTRDRSLCVFAFVYKDELVAPGFDMEGHKAKILASACTGTDCIPRHVLDAYFAAVDAGYLARSHPDRIARHVRAWISLKDTESVHVGMDDFRDDGAKQVTRVLVAGSMNRLRFTRSLARMLARHDLLLERGYLDVVPAHHGEGRTLISTVYLTTPEGRALSQTARRRLAVELGGLKRRFEGEFGALYDETHYAPHHFEVLVAAIDFAAQVLSPEAPFLEVREVGREAMLNQRALCQSLAEMVDMRFGPRPRSRSWWQRRLAELREEILACGDTAVATVLEAMLDFVAAIRVTNLYRDERLGQVFALDPAALPRTQYEHEPYAVLYFHGRHGMGFHIRFRASARGGLRLLCPRNNEQLARSRDRLLREVYDLAWAQQLKNKDIPEGGSKCIALVRPGDDAMAMVKQLSDSLLDLLVPPALVPEVRGAHGAERQADLVFLGPDENMTPERIIWVAERARMRGLPQHLTLMSSKPGAGINHKDYGVTSEGLYTWIAHVLPLIGIKSNQSWTLKITGGPDGDLGGNLIKILHREQPRSCRIVAVADGSGCAYDPGGLDWVELTRLAHAALPIANFDKARIVDKRGHVTPVTDRASEELRNNFHNLIEADLFVPCGGRPYTINDRNWKLFCDSGGKPSARAMVEGANIFITDTARTSLQQAGLLVIKDSSANKGGVICSSYEILACLILDEAEFVEIKEVYARQVIDKLRAFVAIEAEALLEAWRRRRGGVQLSDLSMQFSEEINRISGMLLPLIAELLDDQRYVPIWRRELEEHCPPILVERYRDRLHGLLPRDHVIALLAKRFASRMLYREGLTWCRNYVLEDMARTVFLAYVEAGEEVRNVSDAMAQLGVVSRPETLSAIVDGSRREMVRRRLGR